MTKGIGKYKQWQSAKDKSGNFIIGKVNKINKYLGGNYKSNPWSDVNIYLPSKEDDYPKYKVLSMYNEDLDAIEVQFLGSFGSEIVELAKQVVFKLVDGNDDVLVAEFRKEYQDYDFSEISDNFKILSWEMFRLKPGRDGVEAESARVCMRWSWDGNIDGQPVYEESMLLWEWDPYDN